MTAAPRHPLAPLTTDELHAIVRVVRDSHDIDADAVFVWCALDEPAKEQVWSEVDSPERRALCAVYEPGRRRLQLLSVSLDKEAVVHADVVPAAYTQILNRDWFNNAEAIKADPVFQDALRRRGITDLAAVRIEPWPAGNFGSDLDRSGRRLGRGVAYVSVNPGDNPYARPVENLVAVVDRDTGEVLHIDDGEAVPIPAEPGRYDSDAITEVRDLARLEITQPDGSGFTVDDGLVEWGPWSLRISMHPLEGLVLHDIRWRDGVRSRPILFRASVAEMVVPYGATGINHWWKNAFDIGDCGLGKVAASLRLGCDCLGEITYVDADMLDEDGTTYKINNAICIHEEDYGILWRHTDVVTGVTEVRRSRRLVLSFFATVGNYDYGFFWYLYQDGTIQGEVKLTGIPLMQAVTGDTQSPYANRVARDLIAPHHQHLFCFRLDMSVEGARNTVYEVDALSAPLGPENPHGNAFIARHTRLENEGMARRFASPERARSWLVVNPNVHNSHGQPVAYRLMPTHPATLLAQPQASISHRAAFATRHLWVTAFDSGQRRPAGDFPNQHPGGAGLPEWVQADRLLVDQDVVLWHTAGVTHLGRPEDFPVMPCDYVGFTLKPDGFFDRNPALDLAAPKSTGHDSSCQH